MRIAKPTATQPFIPSILNFIDFFWVPIAGSISAINVYSLSDNSLILIFLGSTIFSEWWMRVVEKR